MQTTLLGLAFAVILALLAALIGPFLVDWTQFRPLFEAEATRMIGLPVRVTGTIDARILPTPSLTLHGLEIGRPHSDHILQARTLDVQFALGPLMRGELQAEHAKLVGPEVTIGLNKDGVLEVPKLAIGFDPDALSIQGLNIEDGTAHLVNAVTGSRITLNKLWFNGDVRSLIGPFKGEGAFIKSGELYGYRVSGGRLGDNGALQLHLSLDPSDRPLTAQADGSLILGKGKPRFDGTVAVSRPARLVAQTGQSKVKPPWRASAQVKAGVDGATLERLDFHYGAEDSGVHLTGTADLRFGRHPLLKVVLSAEQLDLDRLIATKQQPTRLPAAALQAAIAEFAGSLAPPIPTDLSVSADNVTLGGAAVQMFGADLRIADTGWQLDRVEFRAPGLTQVQLSGTLDLKPSAGFTGPVDVETNQPGALAAWLDGRTDRATQIRPFTARGDVTLNAHEVAIDHLAAEIDHKTLRGRLHYIAAQAGKGSRLDADLHAPDIDLDPVLAFAQAVHSGSRLTPPSEVSLAVAIGRARIAGIEAKDVEAKLKRDAKALQIERLSVADFGGARLAASGKIETGGAAPRGNLSLDLNASDLDGLIALASDYAPQAAAPLRRAAARGQGAKLHIALNLDGPAQPAPGAKTAARFSVDGTLGGVRASLDGEADQDSQTLAKAGLFAGWADSDIRVDSKIDGDDGQALVALIGLDRAVAVRTHSGSVNVRAAGKADGALQVSGRILAGGLDANATGTVHLAGDNGPHADLLLDIKSADIRPLGGETQLDSLPLTLHGRLALTPSEARLINTTATLNGTELRGTLAIGFGAHQHVSGQIEADSLDAAAMIATAIGAPPSLTQTSAKHQRWSSEPYGPGQFTDLDGRIGLTVMRASLTPSLLARQVKAELVFHGANIALDQVAAQVAGGQVKGSLSFQRRADGLATRILVDASGLDAAAVLPGGARPAIGGDLSAKLDLEASGRSPRALIGSLAGSGTISLSDGYFSSLDPGVFDTVIRASDRGLAGTPAKIRNIVTAALNSGRLTISHLETTLTVGAGQVRMADAVAKADGADLLVSGSYDLSQQSVNARLTLSGPPSTDSSMGRPDIFIALQGPLPNPQRSIDISALSGWLTIRKIDQEAKKLQALEAARAQATKSGESTKDTPKATDTPAKPTEARPQSQRSLPPDPDAMVGRSPASKPTTNSTPAAKPDHGAAATSRDQHALRGAGDAHTARRRAKSDRTAVITGTAVGKPLQLAPPLPPAIEVGRTPDLPAEPPGGGEKADPALPAWLPSVVGRPSVIDSLVGTPHQR